MRILMIMPFKESYEDVYAACQQAVEKSREYANLPTPHPRAELLRKIQLYRVDEGSGAVSIMDDLLKQMREATLCIADISNSNPNVLWELGYAMALEKPIITLSHDVKSAPFDLAAYRMLPYDRKNLSRSLVDPLASEIAGVLENLPEVAVFPEAYGFARTLAMTMASPAYFLDAEFNIRYMNEAAVAMFLADKAQSAGDWIGKSLVSFMNEFADRLLNLNDIEKNLQVQKETLWRTGDSLPAHPLSIERVVLDTARYGVVEMQKTGIAVRNVNDNQITGWVVSFNYITSREPSRFDTFHKSHKAVLENKILCRGQQALSPPISNYASEDSLNYLESDWSNAEYSWASSYSEKQESFEYMARIMITDSKRYGLKSVKYLTSDFYDYAQTEYLRLHLDGKIIGLLRMHMPHELWRHNSLAPELLRAVEDGQGFADAGIYLPIGTPTSRRLEQLGRLLGRAVERAESSNVTNLYAQVPQRLLKRYKEFGFSEAGGSFACEGWQGKWTPIWVSNWNFPAAESDAALRFQREFSEVRRLTGSEVIEDI